MTRPLIPLILALLLILPLPTLAVGQDRPHHPPGSYGRLDLKEGTPPPLIYARPKSIGPVARERAPIYLHVPPGHARNWRKNCHRYDACGERAYFVRENWYHHQYQTPSRPGEGDSPHPRRDPGGEDHRGPMGVDHPDHERGPGSGRGR